jgi:uncharacterized protein (DUF1330 family)
MSHYLVVIARIPDMTPALAEYSTAVHGLVHHFGGRYVMLGGPEELLEGQWPLAQRLIISAWDSREALLRFWQSDEYQRQTKPLRENSGDYDVVIFEASSLSAPD